MFSYILFIAVPGLVGCCFSGMKLANGSFFNGIKILGMGIEPGAVGTIVPRLPSFGRLFNRSGLSGMNFGISLGFVDEIITPGITKLGSLNGENVPKSRTKWITF